jgi:hypothetical protein
VQIPAHNHSSRTDTDTQIQPRAFPDLRTQNCDPSVLRPRHPAAVNIDRLPDDPLPRRRGEQQQGADQFVGCALGAGADHGGEILGEWGAGGDEAGTCVARHVARRDGVDGVMPSLPRCLASVVVSPVSASLLMP